MVNNGRLSYKHTKCNVVNQTQSNWFPVLQGVRQGGVLSSFLYLVYINELILDLEKSCINTGIFNITSNCTSLADDIACIGITPTTLQQMLDTSYEYSRKWRFTFNAQKSSILQFRAKGCKFNKDCAFNLGDIKIPCSDSYNHLGIVINNKLTLSDRILSACRKGQKSYYALNDIGSNYLNPITLSHLYKSVVLPTVLYGCELWNNLSTSDCQRLNVFQHSICNTKNAQNLPTATRSDICESLFNVITIISEIDVRKLLFLVRLCQMDPKSLPKKVFLTRLYSILEGVSEKQRGFIPDVIDVLLTYNLLNYLQTWLKNCLYLKKKL
jgi:hypothetical protein